MTNILKGKSKQTNKKKKDQLYQKNKMSMFHEVNVTKKKKNSHVISLQIPVTLSYIVLNVK